MNVSKIKELFTSLAVRFLPGVRYHKAPRALSVDSIVKPLGKMMGDLYAAQDQHRARAKAQAEAAEALRKDSISSECEADRAGRLALKIYNFIG